MIGKSDTRAMLLEESPWALVFKLSIPAIIGMLVIGLYNFMDGVYVGQMIGENAMAAVSISYPFTLANTGLSTLLGVGSASVLSRAIGKNDKKVISKIMGNLISLVFIFSIIITVVGIVFTRQILEFSGASGEILDLSVRYLRIIFLGSLFVNFAQSSNMIMRGEGLLKKSMLFSGGSAVLNIIFDPILIFILKPYDMGIEGAAVATVISQIFFAVVSFIYFKKESKTVGINKIRIEKSLFVPIFSVGVSAMLMQVMMLIQQTALYNLAAKFGGDEWQIILGATYRIVSFICIPLWGLSQGFQPAVGTNYGAKKYTRVKELTKVFSIVGTLLAFVFYIPIIFMPKEILSLFIQDVSIIEQGVDAFRLFFGAFFVLGVWIVVLTLMQAIGRASKASVLVILRQIAIYIPAAMILPYIGDLGVVGVFVSPLVTDFVVFVIAIFMAIVEFKKMGELPLE